MTHRHRAVTAALLVASLAAGGCRTRIEDADFTRRRTGRPDGPCRFGFAAPIQYATGRNPHCVAVADFDHDGWPDIAACNGDSWTVSVLSNAGAGRFLPKVDYKTTVAPGTNATDLLVGDLDGDGWEDLVTVNGMSDSLSVLINQRGVGFLPRPDLPTSKGPEAGVIADLDGDGRNDIAIAGSSRQLPVVGAALDIFWNGGGSFQRRDDYLRVATTAVAAGDMDSDGLLDLVVTRQFGGLSVLRNAGKRELGPPRDHASRSDGVLVVADLNGDRLPDVVATKGTRRDRPLEIHYNRGAGELDPPIELEAGEYCDSVVTADLDGDSLVDIGLSCMGSGAVHAFYNRGGHSWSPAVAYNAGATPKQFTITDLDRDGLPDAVTANPPDDTVSVLFGQCE